MVHGDDFISTGPDESLKWMEGMLSKDFKIKTSKIGPDKQDEKELEVLSRILRYTQTGIEMEALTAASVAALTIYDMCKSVDKSMIINSIMLVHKSGGRTGTYNKK